MVPEVIVAGHLCADLLPSFPPDGKNPEPGQTAEIGPAGLWPGGAVANVGGALQRLGIGVELIGLVGDDALGDLVTNLLSRQAAGPLPGIRVAPGETTSYTLILARPGQDRAFLHHPGSNRQFHPAEIDPNLLREGKIVHFGYPPFLPRVYRDGGRRLAEWFGSLREQGLLTSLDLAFPDPGAESGRADWRAFLERVLPHVDLFLPSRAELEFMLRDLPELRAISQPEMPAGLESLSGLARWALDAGARMCALKLGPHGIYLRTAAGRASLSNRRLALDSRWEDREAWAPAFQVTPVGTTGAGDAAVAGFLAGLLGGSSPEETILLATAVAACSVEAPDPTSGIRSVTETIRRVKEGWPRRSTVDCTWRHDDSTGIFLGPRDARFSQ
jgi:sugar/nucleoside kinase (ribokinase family)